MVLASTKAPEIIFATAKVSPEWLQKRTNMCQAYLDFKTEYDLAFAYKKALESPTPVDAFRNFAKQLTIAGPSLDPQMLDFFRQKITNALPPKLATLIEIEMGTALEQARNYRDLTPLVFEPNTKFSGPIYTDTNFLSKLGRDLFNCNAPCNYFSAISDSIGSIANAQSKLSNDTAPIWDTTIQLLNAPINMAGQTFNKIATSSQQMVAEAATSTINTFRQGVSQLFSSEKRQQLQQQLEKGESPANDANGDLYVNDPSAYFETQNNATEIIGKIKNTLGDCFRLFEFNYRYNALDSGMNFEKAMPGTWQVGVENDRARELSVSGTPVLADASLVTKAPMVVANKDSFTNLDTLDSAPPNYNTQNPEQRTSRIKKTIQKLQRFLRL
jgi:hypothetical protein